MIILIGESGSGKTTILNKLEELGFKKAINHTTRPKRENEEQTKEYKFITKQEFEKMWNEGKLLQRAEFNNEYYGISVDSLRDDVACISIVDSVKDIKNKARELGKDETKIKTIYINVPEDERKKRMQQRGDTKESIERRIQIDREKFKKAKEVADYIVENNNIEETLEKIIKYVRKQLKI